MQNELYEKYPYLKNRSNAKIVRIKIAPIGKNSKHKDGSIVLTREAADLLIKEKQLTHMPIHYTKKDSNLPQTHSTNLQYHEIGHLLNEGEIVTEDGIEYLEADGLLHSESQKQYVDEIIANKHLLGNSWELIPLEGYENNGTTNITKISDFIGNAILDKNYTAFEGTKIVYASIGETPMADEINWEEKYKELLLTNANMENEIIYQRSDVEYYRNQMNTFASKCEMYSEMIDMMKKMMGIEEDDREESNMVSY